LLISQLLLPCDLSLPVCLLLLLLLLLLLASSLLLLQLDGGLLLQLEGNFLLFLASSRCGLVIGQLLQPLELCLKFFIFLLLNTLSL
jgi:hypothetical protein